MLPTYYHQNDSKFLKLAFETLTRKFGIALSNAVAQKYSAAYYEQINDTSIKAHKRDNAARFNCNSRLVKLLKSKRITLDLSRI